MSTVCCPAPPLARPARAPQRVLMLLRKAWAAWRAQSRRRAEWQALEPLSESTRRDLGLTERVPSNARRTLWENERGLW